MNLLTGWLRIPAENFDLQAEVAFASWSLVMGVRDLACALPETVGAAEPTLRFIV